MFIILITLLFNFTNSNAQNYSIKTCAYNKVTKDFFFIENYPPSERLEAYKKHTEAVGRGEIDVRPCPDTNLKKTNFSNQDIDKCFHDITREPYCVSKANAERFCKMPIALDSFKSCFNKMKAMSSNIKDVQAICLGGFVSKGNDQDSSNCGSARAPKSSLGAS